MKKVFAVLAILCVLVSMLSLPCLGAEFPSEYCFSDADFSAEEATDGIFLTQVPQKHQGAVYLGSRQLRAGDVVPQSVFHQLILRGVRGAEEAVLVFYPIRNGQTAESTALKIPLGKQENLPPEVKDSSFETYKNISNTGTLSVSDPEGDAMTFTLVKPPRKGTVEFDAAGTFTYTPLKNKVGPDRFTYTASDAGGNISAEASVSIEIVKPESKETYRDMQGDRDEYAAMWLKEQNLFTGERVAEHQCFCPDKAVTRGEFLAMTMKLFGKEASSTPLSTGFADEKNTPSWLQPYLVSALQTGLISGRTSEQGMVFQPTSALTKAEAAVMLQNTLNLPENAETAVFFDLTAVPAWAQSSYSALACAGIGISPEQGILSRREAARLLCRVSELFPEV